MLHRANECPIRKIRHVFINKEVRNTLFLPKGHGTRQKSHQSQCGNLYSYLELPLSSISGQRA